MPKKAEITPLDLVKAADAAYHDVMPGMLDFVEKSQTKEEVMANLGVFLAFFRDRTVTHAFTREAIEKSSAAIDEFLDACHQKAVEQAAAEVFKKYPEDYDD